MEPHRFGCRVCDAVHIGTFTVYPETIRVVRKITRDKAGSVKAIESEYECVSHDAPESP